MNGKEAQQVRILAACGERSPLIARLLGLSQKTVKRLYQQTHAAVPAGRRPGVPRAWFRRERETLRQFLHEWMAEGLPRLLAGETPQFLIRLGRDFGLDSPAQVSAILGALEVGTTVEVRRCPGCDNPYLAFLVPGRHSLKELACPNVSCRRRFTRSATQHWEVTGQLAGRDAPVQ
jgi:hypothetical protein